MEAHDSLGNHHNTAIDCLLAYLEHDPNTSFITLYGDFNTDLITIKNKKKTACITVEVDEFAEDIGDGTNSPEEFSWYCR